MVYHEAITKRITEAEKQIQDAMESLQQVTDGIEEKAEKLKELDVKIMENVNLVQEATDDKVASITDDLNGLKKKREKALEEARQAFEKQRGNLSSDKFKIKV